jgi:crotonobetainyl-CoA:carnitine CoA-transferase CaiB-like acyl-CoA transferase
MAVTGPSVDVFHGVRVVELAQFVFVPVAGALLADWGADVIKIEHPVTGDGYRGLVSQGILQMAAGGLNHSMEMANRGKRGIGIDVNTPHGREVLLKLVAAADVFLTNFRPSALERLGLSVDALREVNPSIIYGRGHGFGVRGPDADAPGYDATAFWARGGIGATLTPPGLQQPINQRGAFGDRNGAVQLAFGIASALFRRERTGEPSVVDVSLLATAMWTMTSDLISALQGNFAQAATAGQTVRRSPNPLSGIYQTADDRFLMLNLLQADRDWPTLAAAIDRPELAEQARFANIPSRAEHRDELVDILNEVFRSHTLAEWVRMLTGKRLPWAPFQSIPEVLQDPQVGPNGYIGEVEVDGAASFRLPTGAVQFDECPAALRRAPEQGQHTDEVLAELGYDWDDIVKLKVSGAVL